MSKPTLLICVLCFSEAFRIPIPLMTDLVTEISEVYNTKCVEILTHKNLIKPEVVYYDELLKSLSTRQITKVYEMEDYGMEKDRENDRSLTKCFRPIRVTIGNRLSRTPFEEVSYWPGNAISKPVSLVFLNDTVETFFENASLPFNLIVMGVVMPSEGELLVYEVFRVDNGFPMRIHTVGNWSANRGISMNRRTVFSRRYDFERKVLRAGSVEKWPLSTFNTQPGDDQVCGGLFCVVWNQLGKLLNFESVYYREESIGIEQNDGQWNGLIRWLLNDTIDVIVADIRMTENRLKILDFTYPLISSWFQIYYRQPGYRLQWSAVFEPFNYDVWLAILLWIAAGTVCFYVSYHWCASRGLESEDGRGFTFVESFFFMIRTLSFQDYNSIPATIVCRTIFLTAYIAAAVLMPAYSASLISFLTQHAPIRPFDSLEGMLQDGTYKLLVEANTSEYAYYSRASDKTLQRVYWKLVNPIPMIHYSNFSSYGLETICKHKNLALFDVQQLIRMKNTAGLSCELLSLTQSLTKVDEGIAFGKGDPFAIYIHHHVHRMTEAGLIRRIRKNVTPKTVKVFSPWNPVKVEEVFQIFSFLLFGMILSLVIFITEIVIDRLYNRERHKTRSLESYDLIFAL